MTYLPLQLIMFSIPTLIYVAIRLRCGQQRSEVFKDIGWQGCRPIYFLWGLGVLIITAGLGWLGFQIMPSEVWENPSVSISAYSGWTLSLTSFLLIWLREAIYVALGEEIFFRGFLGGWLIRRFGFVVGNTLQTLIFLLPHLLLLFVSLDLWPMMLVPIVAGWLLGWLRYRSDSILPSWFVHSLSNAIGALLVMV